MNVRGQDQDIHARLGWIDAKPNEVAEGATDPVIERVFADDQVEAGFEFAVAKRLCFGVED
jgi:hypothetical protein